MLAARLFCCDPVCADESTAEAEAPAELAALMCECGWGLEIIAWPDRLAPDLTPAVVLTPRRVRRRLPHAA